VSILQRRHRSPYEFARSHIVFARVIHCDAPTWYSQRLLGTVDRVYIKVQEQIGFKTCTSPEAPVPPSPHAEVPALELAAAKFDRGDDSRWPALKARWKARRDQLS
jgi:hypothetical protein